MRLLIASADDGVEGPLVRILESRGYTVDRARHGMEALERIKVDPPDLVVADLSTPRIDGLSLCLLAQGLNGAHSIPFVLRGGDPAGPDRTVLEGARETGCCTIGPAEPEAMAAMIDELLAERGADCAAVPSGALLSERLEAALREADRARVQRDLALATATEGVFGMDRHGRVSIVNPAAAEMLGYSAEELIGRDAHQTFHEWSSAGEEYPAERCPIRRSLEGGEVLRNLRETFWRKDGTPIPVEFSSTPRKVNGEIDGVVVVFRDVSEQDRDARLRESLTRSLRVLSAANQAMVRAASEAELFDTICRASFEAGGYAGAWIGLAGEDHPDSARIVAAAGPLGECLDEMQRELQSNDIEGLAVQTPLRTGRPRLVRSIADQEECRPAAPLCTRYGLRSALALPIHVGDRPVGIFTLVSREVDGFDDQAQAVLVDLSADIGFGLQFLRTRDSLQRTVGELESSEQRLESILSKTGDGVVVVDSDETIRFVNPAAEELLGRERGKLVGAPFGFPLVTHESADIEVLRPDGEPRAVEMRAVPGSWEDREVWILTLHDVTDRKRAAEERIAHERRLQQALGGTVLAMGRAVEARDPYTAGHQDRVAELAVAIARRMGLDEERVEGIRMGALIHDVGKIKVPAEILNKPTRLSDTEFAIIRQHPQTGYEMVRDIDFPWPVAEMIHQHHERLDGSGYPRGLSGEDVILDARILAVADVVEAMASHRPYRPAVGLEPALEVIREGRERLFETAAVDACVELFEKEGFAWG